MHHGCILTSGLYIYKIPMKTGEKAKYTLRLGTDSRMIVGEREEKQKIQKKDDTWYFLGLASEIGYSIAIPIVGGALLGRYIDFTWSIYPKATLSLLFFGIVISVINFVRTIKEMIDRKSS
jgi:predicted F0F1-ATPase subunit